MERGIEDEKRFGLIRPITKATIGSDYNTSRAVARIGSGASPLVARGLTHPGSPTPSISFGNEQVSDQHRKENPKPGVDVANSACEQFDDRVHD